MRSRFCFGSSGFRLSIKDGICAWPRNRQKSTFLFCDWLAPSGQAKPFPSFYHRPLRDIIDSFAIDLPQTKPRPNHSCPADFPFHRNREANGRRVERRRTLAPTSPRGGAGSGRVGSVPRPPQSWSGFRQPQLNIGRYGPPSSVRHNSSALYGDNVRSLTR